MSPLLRIQQRVSLRRGLVVAALALAVWLAELLGVFLPLDNLAYDAGLGAKSRINPLSVGVLLIRSNRDLRTEPDTVAQAIRKLRALGAGAIACTFSLADTSASQSDARFASVTFGYHATTSSADPRDFEAAPSLTKSEVGGRGLLLVHPSTDGVHRLQRTSIEIDGIAVPTIETVVVESVRETAVPRGQTFRIDFRGGVASLPHAALDDVLSNRMIPELVADKIVVIGMDNRNSYHAVTTPITKGVAQMSTSEYHAHGINTLLANAAIRNIAQPFHLAVLIGVAFTASIGFRYCNFAIWFWLAPTVVLGICGVSTACLIWNRIWFPWSPSIATVIAVLLAQGVGRVRYLQGALQRLTVEQSARTRRRRWPTDPVTAQDPWPQLLDFVAQLLPFERMMALEVHAGKQHLSDAGYRGCGPEDIAERRRDYSRLPYQAAAHSRRPHQLDERRFFKTIQANSQFMVPFCYAGETYGFLAVDVPTHRIESNAAFMLSLETISNVVSGILYRRSCLSLAAATHRSQQNDVRHDMHQLYGDTRDLDCRLTRFEHMFQGAEVASIVYDLYGQVLMINDRMSSLLSREKIAAPKCDATALIQRLCGCDEHAAKRMFGDIALHRRKRTVRACLRNTSGKYSLIGRPLAAEPSNDMAGVGDPNSLDIWGVEFELIDQSQFDALDWLESELESCLGP